MEHLRRSWARTVQRKQSMFGNIGAEVFYDWEARMERIYGTGRRVGDASAQKLMEQVMSDYGIDSSTVNLVVGVGETYTEFQFSTKSAKVRVSDRNQNTWSLLHELAHVILFHRDGKEHEWDHHGVSLQVQLIELLDRYTGIRIKPEHRGSFEEQMLPKTSRRHLAAPRRKDQHSIVNLDPAAYKYVMFVDLKAAEESEHASRILEQPYGGGNQSNIDWAYSVYSEADMLNARLLYDRIKKNKFEGNFINRGGCDHCGAHSLRFVNVYQHADTNDWIVFGSTCAERVGLENRNAYELDRARRADEARKKAAEIRRKQDAWRQANDPEVVAVLDDLLVRWKANEQTGTGNHFLNSMVIAFRNYGGLTERQRDAMMKTVRDLEARKQKEEADRANPKPTVPVPSGVIEITGTVISIKEQFTQWGTSWKCVVADDRGFRVWGTIPSGASWGKGDRVSFTASVEASSDDPSFGFYSRPRKVKEAPPAP